MSERVGDIRRGRNGPRVPGGGEAESDWRADGRRGRGLTGPLALAISGLVLYLVWSALWERSHPASAAARALREGDAAARLHAMRDLERLGPQDPEVALSALIEGLADPVAANRDAAISGLVAVIHGDGGSGSDPGQVGEAITALMARLEDADALVRARSAQALWTIVLSWQGSPRVVDPDAISAALNELAEDNDPQVRAAAISGLGLVGHRLSDDPPPRLVAALEDESEGVRTAAAHCLTRFHRGLPRLLPRLVKSLETTRPAYRPSYLAILREIRPGFSGGPAPEEMVPALVAALGSRDREVRLYVARALGQFGTRARQAIPALVALLSEPEVVARPGPARPGDAGHETEPDLAAEAAWALRRVAGDRATPGDSEGLPGVREAVTVLGRLLRSPDPRRRAAAAGALGRLAPGGSSGRAAIPALAGALADPTVGVRSEAIESLVRFGSAAKEAIPALLLRMRRAGDERSAYEAAAIADAVRIIAPGTPAEDQVLTLLIEFLGRESDLQYLTGIIDAVARFGPRAAAALPRLREREASADPRVREAARRAVAAIAGLGRSVAGDATSAGRPGSGPPPRG